jgi:hypothetical protein
MRPFDQTKEAIKATYNDKRQKYLPLWKIIDNRLIMQLYQCLHVVGDYLNSRCHYPREFELDGEVNEVIKHMILHVKIQDKIHNKLVHFNDNKDTFNMSMVVQGRTKDPPRRQFHSF